RGDDPRVPAPLRTRPDPARLHARRAARDRRRCAEAKARRTRLARDRRESAAPRALRRTGARGRANRDRGSGREESDGLGLRPETYNPRLMRSIGITAKVSSDAALAYAKSVADDLVKRGFGVCFDDATGAAVGDGARC